MIKKTVFCLWALLVMAPLEVYADAGRARCQNWQAERQLLFGDLHVHTKYSLDASTQGTRTSPADAYRFARGGSLPVQPWLPSGEALRHLKLERPLDFAAVTDHAELLGEREICLDAEQQGYSSWQCRLYREWPRAAFFLFNTQAARAKRLGFCGDDGEYCRQQGSAAWQDIRRAAESAYDRSEDCRFTSFVAYEWTGAAQNLANLHRNIIFRNEHVPSLPLSFIDAPSAAQLWDGLDQRCGPASSLKDCEVLVIPHNSNLSDGYMFALNDDGTALSRRREAQRARLERVVEIMQHKGSSECFYDPLQTEDELCGFEQLPYGSFRSKFLGKVSPMLSEPPGERSGFLREVLRDGMAYAQRDEEGRNPLAVGFIGSSDTHISAAGAVSESQFLGHGGAGVPAGDSMPSGLPDDLEFNPGGLAAVWAEENSRDAIFDALQRREVYATSGPRIGMRLFAAADLPEDMCERSDFSAIGYRSGVPMGGELVVEQGVAPVFAVMAAMDVGSDRQAGLPLQKLQIIKGSVGADGQRSERVFDIAHSGKQASVDLASCQTRGAGAAQLCAVWRDPDFDPDGRHYYYARAVENPRCRWSQQVCVAASVDCSKPDAVAPEYQACCRADHRRQIRERAWSSPVWVQAAGA
ncbi:DUF3604 domain-containing protein [Spongiibacter sp.]|uniref:DUF3604 domain-containing protein n=1 Tax=Spongiibacter sp. TaxID=2024860 RepID=UPI0035661C22